MQVGRGQSSPPLEEEAVCWIVFPDQLAQRAVLLDHKRCTHFMAAQNWTPLPGPLPFRRGEGEATAAFLHIVRFPALPTER